MVETRNQNAAASNAAGRRAAASRQTQAAGPSRASTRAVSTPPTTPSGVSQLSDASSTGTHQVIQMVQPVKAPVLKNLSRLGISEFKVAYDRYLQSTQAHGIVGRTKIECIDTKLMRVLSAQYISKEIADITN